jgi:hypothetical protein
MVHCNEPNSEISVPCNESFFPKLVHCHEDSRLSRQRLSKCSRRFEAGPSLPFLAGLKRICCRNFVGNSVVLCCVVLCCVAPFYPPPRCAESSPSQHMYSTSPMHCVPPECCAYSRVNSLVGSLMNSRLNSHWQFRSRDARSEKTIPTTERQDFFRLCRKLKWQSKYQHRGEEIGRDSRAEALVAVSRYGWLIEMNRSEPTQ